MQQASPTAASTILRRAASSTFRTGGRPTVRMAAADLIAGFLEWELWLTMAWQDIKQRYRGSMLGPFWVTLSMGVMVGALSIVYGQLFGQALKAYIPFLTLGFLVWLWLASATNESTQLFVGAQRYVKQIKLPITLFVFRLLARNLIIFAHNFVIYLVVVAVVGLNPGWIALLAIPGMILGTICMFWIGLFFAMLGARFRDFPQIVASVVQVIFYVTPILWQPSQLGGRRYFVLDYNPVYYFVEIVREPLLGHAPPVGFWKVTIILALVLTAIVFPMFVRFRGRIAYWV